MEQITTLRNRLMKIGIETTYLANYPWIYLDRVNGKRVTELFEAEHGFTIAFAPIRVGQFLKFTDLRTIFETIRKYK